MLQVEHSAILLTFIKLPFVIKIFVLSIFEWPFYTGFTVMDIHIHSPLLNMHGQRKYRNIFYELVDVISHISQSEKFLC